MHGLARVGLSRAIDASLLGQHVHDHGARNLRGVADLLFEFDRVVPVEGSEVVDTKCLEEGSGLPHLPDRRLGRVYAPVDQPAQPRQLLGDLLEAALSVHVGGVGADVDEA